MKLAADVSCARCRLALDEYDGRAWAVRGDLVVCPNCLAPADGARGLVASVERTALLHVAACHPAALDTTLSVFERYVRDGRSGEVALYLRAISERPFGHDAVAALCWALLVEPRE